MSILTSEQIRDLEAVGDGADIYDRISAGRYRYLEARGLVSCTAPSPAPLSDTKPRPYFGVLLTVSGARLLREYQSRVPLNQSAPDGAGSSDV